VTYRWRPTPLHAARAGAAALWWVGLVVAVLAVGHPVALLVALLVVLAAAAAAQALGPVARALTWGLPFAALIALLNLLVVREGLTVIARGGSVPVLGELDITLEATLYGGVLGLRALVLIALFALWSVAVDPDAVLRGLRRFSYRSALATTLATRMVGVLARDAQRLGDARRARGATGGRLVVLRAVTGGALERALDVAATLEVRGYGGAARPPRMPRPWSRHDLAFAAAGLALLGLAAGAVLGGWAPFAAYPRFRAPVDGELALVLAALAAAALAPFLDARGVGR